MYDILISICIPVYNQSELLKWVLNKLIVFKDSDFEIVVCDNASEENLEAVVSEFNDPRIHYYKNETNLGQDLNILQCLKHAQGKYAYLLRTKDYILPGAIEKLRKIISDNPNLSVLESSCITSTGCVLINTAIDSSNRIMENKTYAQGLEAFSSTFNLCWHPFGIMYSLKKLNIQNIEHSFFFIPENKRRNIFCLTQLLHFEEAMNGDIITVDSLLWNHGDDTGSSLPSANSGNCSYPYAPETILFNYIFISTHILQNFTQNYYYTYFTNKFRQTLTWNTYFFKFLNLNPNNQIHYKVNKIKHDISSERKKLYTITCGLISKYIDDKKLSQSILRECKHQIFLNQTIGYMKFIIDYARYSVRKYGGKHIYLKKCYYCIKPYIKVLLHK